jgi:2-polyprenyl-3-methyl-5-hydroxy-6-metoxy-1,4-benzoquinol methylase
MTLDKYDDLFDVLDQVERYQDVRVNGKTIVEGMRDCDHRYECIKAFVNNPNRPFTILDVGANFGYYSIRLLEDFPLAFAVLIQPYEEAKVLKKVVELNTNINDRIIILNAECNKENMERLSKCEHFDLILCLNILHHFEDPLDIYDSIKQMTRQLIIETPPVNDLNSCGQQNLESIFNIVNKECHKKSAQGFERHTLRSTYSHIYEYSYDLDGIKTIPFFKFPSNQAISIDGSEKKFIHKFKGDQRIFQKIENGSLVNYKYFHGINLNTFFSLNGIYPSKIELLEKLNIDNIDTDYAWDNSLRDIVNWNFILNEKLCLIDDKDSFTASQMMQKKTDHEINDQVQLNIIHDDINRHFGKKINVIRKHAKGDVFLIEPILTQLGQKYRVNLTTKHPNIFNLLNVFSINQTDEYDITIHLDNVYETYPKQHILTAYLNEVKKWVQEDIVFRSPEIQFTEEEKYLIGVLAKEPFVVINIDPSEYYQNTRRVYGLDVKKMAEEIQNKYGLKVIEVGLFNTYDLPRIALKNEREAMVLIAASRLFIGLDSFFLHIAGALKKKAIGFFGAVNPNYRLFENNHIKIFQNNCERQHCYHNAFHYGEKACELNMVIPKCAEHGTDDVIEAIHDLLE